MSPSQKQLSTKYGSINKNFYSQCCGDIQGKTGKLTWSQKNRAVLCIRMKIVDINNRETLPSPCLQTYTIQIPFPFDWWHLLCLSGIIYSNKFNHIYTRNYCYKFNHIFKGTNVMNLTIHTYYQGTIVTNLTIFSR